MIFKPKHQIKNPRWVKAMPHITIICLFINIIIVYTVFHDTDIESAHATSFFYAFWILACSMIGYRIEKDKIAVDVFFRIMMIAVVLMILGTTIMLASMLMK